MALTARMDSAADALHAPVLKCPFHALLHASAEACNRAWKGHFKTGAWRASAAESMRAVSAIYFHWAGLVDFWRPAEDE